MESPQPKKRNKYLKNIGIALIMIGSVMCINPYWWLFAVPILIIGIILNSLSKPSSRKYTGRLYEN